MATVDCRHYFKEFEERYSGLEYIDSEKYFIDKIISGMDFEIVY